MLSLNFAKTLALDKFNFISHLQTNVKAKSEIQKSRDLQDRLSWRLNRCRDKLCKPWLLCTGCSDIKQQVCSQYDTLRAEGPATWGDWAYKVFIRCWIWESCGKTQREDAGNLRATVRKECCLYLEILKNFDQKHVKKTVPYLFFMLDFVLVNVKQRLSDLKNVGILWIGPCTVVYEHPFKPYNTNYKCEGQA